jgi:hypothetical protein
MCLTAESPKGSDDPSLSRRPPALTARLARLCLLVLALAAAAPAGATGFRLLRLDGAVLKWGEPRMGTGATVTWGFATGDAAFPDAINCKRLAPMSTLVPVWGGNPRRLAKIADGAFAMWSRVADVSFRPAAPGETPDILIGAEGVPYRVAFANVWHGTPKGGIAPLTRATICFNPEQAWSASPGPAPAGTLDLETVLAHEIGHTIGLDHPSAKGSLMGYSNQGSVDHLMPGDIAGAVALYGTARN